MPSERILFTQGEESLLELAMRSGVHINASCGGSGSCGKCKVRIMEGIVDYTTSTHLSPEDVGAGFRLACSVRPLSDVTVEVPLASQVDRTIFDRTDAPARTLSPDAREERIGDWRFDPPVRLVYVELPIPSLDDSLADFERLARELERSHGVQVLSASLPVLRDLGGALRRSGWRVTASLEAHEAGYGLIHVSPGESGHGQYALAIDVGTTSVCGELIDCLLCRRLKEDSPAPAGAPSEGSVLAQYADYNSQISFGEDVISRIFYARKKGGLKRLQRALASTINGVIEELVLRGGIEKADISHAVFTGNTTMMHLLLAIDPGPIMLEPYVPTAKVLPPAKAIDLGIDLEPPVPAFFAPCVSSYVGGDIVAGVVGSGMAKGNELTLFMDLGTNGEIVVGNREWLVCASCSAGPAFEGGGIQFGMRAGIGAVEQVRINPLTFEPMILTIGKVKPMGICGSGLIDLVAELLEARLVDERGKFRRDLPTERIRYGDGAAEYVLCFARETQIGKDIVITEVDLDNLLRAKAAMFAGCRVVAGSVGLTLEDMERIIIAGGFGHSIDIEKAQAIGLLPELPPERFVYLGNGSLFGARLCALSRDFMEESLAVARMMTNLELSVNNQFTGEFTAAMFFPHTEARIFPKTTKRLWGPREPGMSAENDQDRGALKKWS
jgi:uncharacterized 2Fe-2S/4Fe-4S cluster protein (DUF4445 family)